MLTRTQRLRLAELRDLYAADPRGLTFDTWLDEFVRTAASPDRRLHAELRNPSIVDGG